MVTGRVTATNGGQALSGIAIAFGAQMVISDATGAFSSVLPFGDVRVSLTAAGILPRSVTAAVNASRNLPLDAVSLSGGFDLTAHASAILPTARQIFIEFRELSQRVGTRCCSSVNQLSTCSPQIIPTLVRAASRSRWLETVLMMKTAENRSGDDAVAFANPVAAQDRLDVRAVGNARPQARVWTPAIVMPRHFVSS
jgi:hypothetical protein